MNINVAVIELQLSRWFQLRHKLGVLLMRAGAKLISQKILVTIK